MAIRFDKLTLKAQEALQQAQTLAADRGNPQIEPLHLLAALVAETEGIVGPILEKIGANRGSSTASFSPSWATCPKSPAAPRPRWATAW